ncbi:hypothetical protein JI721_14135 [Alicyclobacillus cycloheptanicus]|uniref:Uncharacterized protein n=1 Tax=Alicyclobacillus cycloheptanicus TaxID=1457 RepID=A0ABT9XLX9_9BACL|nr:hypothetical protein [Alicyclobacillus cycloheptanicus]WDM00817.1 hypothetical protein JI721_14135 [Alicyclobacillus cycloheptanicus]
MTQPGDQVFRTGFREMASGVTLPLGTCMDQRSTPNPSISHDVCDHGAPLKEAVSL